MRIFTASLATETNTFSPVPTNMNAFKAAFYAGPGEHPDTPTLCSSVVPILRRRGREEGFTVIEGTSCWAEPAGLIQRQTYETLRDLILAELKAALPVDGVVLGLHGAMAAQGYDDPEGDFLARVRAIVGPDVLIAAEFDPHSHLTALRVANLDLMAAFLEFPHTDFEQRTVVMFRGDMVETGPTDEIFASPKDVYTKSLLASIPRLGTMGAAAAPKRFPEVDPATGVATDGIEMSPVSRTVEPILKVDNLAVRFDLPKGRVHAVEDVSFDLRPGETLSLVGESGCGKSTTGRAIIRLLTPTAGSIVINGQDVTKAGTRELRAMRRTSQMIFQDPFASLNPRITVGSAIAEPILAHGLMGRRDAKARVAELLEQVGLSANMADRHPHEFSGGQRQRISIARALALEPKFIVADEAVSALDVSVKAQVSNLLLDLQQKHGLAYLFISHDMAVVERMSHRVAVMFLGEIVEIGPRAAIVDNPQHPYTRRLIAAVPIPDPARRGLTPPPLSEEIKSPIRPFDYVVPKRTYREVSPGHFVQEIS